MVLTGVGQVGHEPVVDLRTGDDPAGRGAVLAGIPEAERLEVLDDGLHVGVVEHDHRRLAAELEVEPLDPVRGDLGDVLAGVGVAGDRDHPDLGVADERIADRRARPGDDVEDAGRQDVGGDLAEDEGRQRRSRRWLEDDRVARREGRADLPAGHHDRVVPRRDRGDHADRLAPDHRGQAGRVLVDGLAFHHPRAAGEEAQVVDDDRDLVDRGADRLAGVLRLEATELVGTRLDPVGELQQHEAALGRGGVLPRLERGRRGVRGPIHVLRVRRLDPGDDRAVGRVLDVEQLSRRRVHPLAADELLVGLDALGDVGHGSVPPGRSDPFGMIGFRIVLRRRNASRPVGRTAISRRAGRTGGAGTPPRRSRRWPGASGAHR